MKHCKSQRNHNTQYMWLMRWSSVAVVARDLVELRIHRFKSCSWWFWISKLMQQFIPVVFKVVFHCVLMVLKHVFILAKRNSQIYNVLLFYRPHGETDNRCAKRLSCILGTTGKVFKKRTFFPLQQGWATDPFWRLSDTFVWIILELSQSLNYCCKLE